MATIKDVAKYAGVGIGTVSRVINNKGAVKPSTKAKVEEAIRALNFRPNEIARSFKMQNSKMIALLIPRINHPFFSELAFHVGGELYKRGYKLMICNAEFEADNELSYIEMLKQNKVEGMIILSYNDIDAYISSELPIVTIDRHYSAGITCITSDNYRG
ncbi:MAG: LacI family DNA-binding transcriptional regulator, partial [Bacillaceae bacterium]